MDAIGSKQPPNPSMAPGAPDSSGTSTAPCGYCGAALSLPARTGDAPSPGGDGSSGVVSYWRCGGCGSLNLRPLPRREDNRYFDDPAAVGRMDAADVRRRGFLRERLGALEAAANPSTPTKPSNRFAHSVPRRGFLLEIGCATGRFLELSRESGWSVEGVELSPTLAEAARTLLPGVVVHTGDAMELDALPWGRCAAVVALDVIEHTVVPAAFAARLARLLAPGGVALLHTANADGLRARTQGARWNMRIPEYHYHLATPCGLKHLADSAGFRTVSARTTSGTGQEQGAGRRFVFRLKTRLLGALRLGNGLEVVWKRA